MPLLDANFINKEIDAIADTIIVKVVTATHNDWGDQSETTTDITNVKCKMRVMNQDDDLVKEGTFQAGDIAFYFKGNQASIARGNRIVFNSKTYEITETTETYFEGTKYLAVARTKIV